MRIDVMIINRGGYSAAGKIELRLNNETLDIPAAETDRINGFGQWHVEKEVYVGFKNGTERKQKFNVTLYHNGEFIESKEMVELPGFGIFELILAVVIIAIIIKIRKYRGKRSRKNK